MGINPTGVSIVVGGDQSNIHRLGSKPSLVGYFFGGRVSLFVPAMNSSSIRCPSSSVYWMGGDFMKQAEGATSDPLRPLSRASLQHLIASMTIPAELGLSHTSSLSSRFRGSLPKVVPSMRM